MDENLTTVVKTRACEFRVMPTPRHAVNMFGPVQFCLKTGAMEAYEWFHTGEALALIAALQLVVDGVDREGRGAFDAHVAGQLAERKFIEVPVSSGVQDA